MRNFNCAIIHIPKLYKENGRLYSSINYCAAGLFSLAGELEKSNFKVKIIHAGVEKYLDKSFKLSDYIKLNDIKFLAFSLQWHAQSYDVIETVSEIKKINPNVHISLGGYTASFFAEEIMNKFPFIDSIIKGEGEIPIVKLVKALSKKNSLDNIPNLYRRKNGEIILNKEIFTAGNEQLSSFEFFNRDKMLNFDTYIKAGYIIDYDRNFSVKNSPSSHNVILGRGCSGNCVWCGGGFNAQKNISNRNYISYRSPKSITEEIKNLKTLHNTEIFRFSFDPEPNNRIPLIKILNAIEKKFKREITAVYNMDGLPDKEFLNAFKRAFSEKSLLLLSPVFADEDLRAKYKSFCYTNKQFETVLDYMENLNINSEIYFSLMPSISNEENEKSKNYGNYLKSKYKNVKEYYIYPVEIEPASPWTFCPQKFGLKNVKTKFIEYYEENRGIEKSFESDIFTK